MLVLEERVSADDMPTLKMVEDHSVRDVEEGLVGAFATLDREARTSLEQGSWSCRRLGSSLSAT